MANPTTPSSRTKRKAPENPTSTPPSARLTRSALSKLQPKPEETEVKPEAVESAGGDKAVEEKIPLKSSKKLKKEAEPARKTGNELGKAEVPLQDESSEGSAECEQLCEEEVDEKVEEKVVKQRFAPQKRKKNDDDEAECRFLGEPIRQSEAEKKWPDRYKKKSGRAAQSDDNDELPARRHYRKAEVDGGVYGLNDSVYIKAEVGKPNFIGRIIEFFESTNNQLYFTVQWFFRAEDTVIAQCSAPHDPKRVFLSNETNTNVLDCIVSKITIIQVDETIHKVPHCDFYYDMMYSVPYTSFTTLSSEKRMARSESSSTVTSETASDNIKEEVNSDFRATLLDLYSGCGAMSTGLCIGAQLSGLKLETAWAVDLNHHACKSLQHNHTHTQVRNMNAEHFLILLKEWEKLCKKYGCVDDVDQEVEVALDCPDENSLKETEDSDEEFEVERFLDICYGDPTSCGTEGLKFKVRWKGYDSDEDTWEPMENLGECQERLREFVLRGQKLHILPCPGDVDVVCGGPPCQGISGFNRFRNSESPLDDVKNRQIVVFMDIVKHLRPKYVLMENVVDLLKFSDGFLGRYAVSRLVQMKYQSRLGIMAAGCYGLPQFRGRAFLWGALTDKKLPQFPLPTHNVVVRGNVPKKFELNLVAFDENQPRNLKKALYLADAISDLPPVENDEERDEITYDKPPQSDFQNYIRLSKSAMMGDRKRAEYHDRLFDHRPLKLNEDDYQRVQRIPIKKGANFRDLPGLIVRDNIVELDPAVERVYLPSKKPLVPDYAISFLNGKSTKPFGRLWWDEIVPTVVTRAEPHNQVILHPEQYRVLTIRENARLQGFPDHYQLFGPVKERYIQVGNAVAVPAARALGFCLGKAFLGLADSEPLLTLPADYP